MMDINANVLSQPQQILDISSLEGKLLVASPNIHDDPYFSKSMVYIFSHEKGATVSGFIINKPICHLDVDSLLPEDSRKNNTNKYTFPLLYGGPVNIENLFICRPAYPTGFKLTAEPDSFLSSDIYIDTCKEQVVKDLMRGKYRKSILFQGCSVWQDDQIRQEISENDWFVARATTHVIFHQTTQDKWSNAIRHICGTNNINETVSYQGHS